MPTRMYLRHHKINNSRGTHALTYYTERPVSKMLLAALVTMIKLPSSLYLNNLVDVAGNDNDDNHIEIQIYK